MKNLQTEKHLMGACVRVSKLFLYTALLSITACTGLDTDKLDPVPSRHLPVHDADPECSQRIYTWQNDAAEVQGASLTALSDPVSRPMDVLFSLNSAALDFQEKRARLLELMSESEAVNESRDPANPDIVLIDFVNVSSELVTFVAAELELTPFPGSTSSVASLENINIEASRRSGITKLVRTFGVRGRKILIAMHEPGPPQGSHEEMRSGEQSFRQRGRSINSDQIRPFSVGNSKALCAAKDKSSQLRNICHATHVMGTLAAGRNSGDAAGMASEAIVLAGPPLSGSNWDDPLWTNAQIGNHSYGYGCKVTGDCYSPLQLELLFRELQATADYAAIEGDHLAVFAAGNNRGKYTENLFPCGDDVEPYGTIAGAGTAKNTLAVGSLADDELLRVSRFSNVGPTMDGRLKPEVVANGELLYSIGVALDGDFESARYRLAGTSMAAPVVTGAGALLQEVAQSFRKPGKELSSYGLRSALIHGACPLPTNPDNSEPGICAGADTGPNYTSGFGEINAFISACALANVYGGLVDEQILKPGEKRDYILAREDEGLVSAGEVYNQRIRRECFKDRNVAVTLTWLDEPGQELIHDLDVRLISPSGESFLPWKLDPWNPSRLAVRGDNTKDSVEKITLPAERAPEGTWRVEVSSKSNVERPVKFAVSWSGLQQLKMAD